MTTRKMRMMAASLALVLCVSLYSVPRAKAVATEVAVGTAAVASYFQATGLTMAASAGSTGALITTSVADIAGSYAMATGAASSGSAFLSSVAAGVSISPAGALVLTAAAVVAIGALVAWYVGEKNLDSAGASSPVTSVSSDGFSAVSSNGQSLFYRFTKIVHTSGDPYLVLSDGRETFAGYSGDKFYLQNDSLYQRYVMSGTSSGKTTGVIYKLVWKDSASGSTLHTLSPNYANVIIRDDVEGQWIFSQWLQDGQGYYRLNEALTLYCSFADYPWLDDFFGLSSSELSVVRAPEFTQPNTELDAESQKQMIIDAGFPAGTTLDTVATQVPELIASGNLAPTYEITISPGEGTDPEPEPEPELQPEVVPLLQSIKTTLTSIPALIADSVMDGLRSLFVPDESFFAEAVPALQETFQDRMGLLTFPISLLADFMGRLLNLSDQEPILRWNSVSIYGTQLIAAGQYNLKDALKSAQVKQMYDIYMVVVNAILIFAFLGLCHNKYRKIMQN